MFDQLARGLHCSRQVSAGNEFPRPSQQCSVQRPQKNTMESYSHSLGGEKVTLPGAQAFTYHALETANTIRLLELNPGISVDPLRGQLHHVDLASPVYSVMDPATVEHYRQASVTPRDSTAGHKSVQFCGDKTPTVPGPILCMGINKVHSPFVCQGGDTINNLQSG
jgi:hypothetical protein